MNKSDVNLKDFEAKELKTLKTHMDYMYNDLRKWGIKDCRVIDLFPEVKGEEKKPAKPTKDEATGKEKKVEKEEKHIGYYIIQGNIKSSTGETFQFQIVREHKMFKDNGQPQYKVILQYGINQCIETYPQTNPDLKAILLNYVYSSKPKTLKLHVEEAKPEKAKANPKVKLEPAKEIEASK